MAFRSRASADGDEVAGEVCVDDEAVAVVGDGVFEQGCADSADPETDGLTVGELGADDAPASRTPSMRRTRTMPRRASTATSANTAS